MQIIKNLYSMVWYGMVWYGMVWYGMVWYGMVWYGMVWYVIYEQRERVFHRDIQTRENNV
jgi:hypothetical protein